MINKKSLNWRDIFKLFMSIYDLSKKIFREPVKSRCLYSYWMLHRHLICCRKMRFEVLRATQLFRICTAKNAHNFCSILLLSQNDKHCLGKEMIWNWPKEKKRKCSLFFMDFHLTAQMQIVNIYFQLHIIQPVPAVVLKMVIYLINIAPIFRFSFFFSGEANYYTYWASFEQQLMTTCWNR